MDKIEKLRLKVEYYKKAGKLQQAYNLEKKIKQLLAKAEYKEKRGKTGVGKIIKKVKDKVVETAEKVNDELPKVTIKIKKKDKKKD